MTCGGGSSGCWKIWKMRNEPQGRISRTSAAGLIAVMNRPEANGCAARSRARCSRPDLLERCKLSLADAEAALGNPSEAAAYNWQSIAADLREVIAQAEDHCSPAVLGSGW